MNRKEIAEKNKLKSPDGKPYVRSESRPLDMTTCFANHGDSSTVIGGGTAFKWNAAIDTFTDVDANFMKFEIDFGFKDEVAIKEGSIYWWDVDWYGQIEMITYLPAAFSGSVDVPLNKFVSHFIHGDCPMGDELNTECASNKIPAYIRHKFIVTIPKTATLARGFMSLEVYRTNTI